MAVRFLSILILCSVVWKILPQEAPGQLEGWTAYRALLDYLKILDYVTKAKFRDQWDRFLVENRVLSGCFEEKVRLESDEEADFDSDVRCGALTLQGRRPTQEDSLICVPGMHVPSFSETETETEIQFSLLAVFDGHGGREASAVCAKCFHKFFIYHVYNVSMTALETPEAFASIFLDVIPSISVPSVVDTAWLVKYFWKSIMKEAVRRAILHSEQAFIKSAENGLEGGTTACVAIETDGHVLIANVGDSKALLCSSDEKAYDKLCTEELTTDHHPDRSDEKARIEASGAYVKDWGGIARVNGVLAVSRSIGDLPYKKYGVISMPEFTGWTRIAKQNKYLVLASDGVFETLSADDVCRVIDTVESGKDISMALREKLLTIKAPIPLLPPQMGLDADGCHHNSLTSVSERVENEVESFEHHKMPLHNMVAAILGTALKLGSADNVAAIVYGLQEYRKDQNIAVTEELSLEVRPEPYYLSELLMDTAAHRNPQLEQYSVAGTLLSHEGARFCYSLMEPLEREIISPSKYDIPGASLEKALASIDKLCVSSLSFEHALSADTTYLAQCANGTEANHLFPDHKGEQLPANIQRKSGIKAESFLRFIDRIASVPIDKESFLSDRTPTDMPPFMVQHYRYILKKKFARGSFGEIWLAIRKECSETARDKPGSCDWRFYDESSIPDAPVRDDELFVLKQILLNGHPGIRLSGLREKHFGELFLNASRSQISVDEGLNHVARFVDSFMVQGEDLWLVFKKEGQSLSRLLYESEMAATANSSRQQDFQVLKPSKWWRWLKSTEAGQHEMRSLIYQLVLAVKACHDRNITHRDIKPENMVVQAAGSADGMFSSLRLRIIDFGSAIDSFTLRHLYGVSGPSRSEHTPEYAPPEALLLDHWMHFHPHQTKTHDIWSIGVVMLEMLLGTPHVFQISSRTQVLLDKNLVGWDEDSRNVAYMLRAFMEMCILVPHAPPRHHRNETINQQEGGRLASMDCSEAALLRKIQQRDPLGLGVPDIWALRLLRLLLQWYPEDRISVDEALEHPYFHPEKQGP